MAEKHAMSAGEKPTTDIKYVDGIMWVRVVDDALRPGEREAWRTTLGEHMRITLPADGGLGWIARTKWRMSIHERFSDAARWAHLHRFSGPHEYDGPGRPVPPHKSGGGQWG